MRLLNVTDTGDGGNISRSFTPAKGIMWILHEGAMERSDGGTSYARIRRISDSKVLRYLQLANFSAAVAYPIERCGKNIAGTFTTEADGSKATKLVILSTMEINLVDSSLTSAATADKSLLVEEVADGSPDRIEPA